MKSQFVFMLGFLLAVGIFQTREIFAGEIYLGAAKSEITPPVGTPLGGYGKFRGKASQGIHDPLFARALALTRDEETFVFVSADLVLIDREMRAAVLKKIPETVKDSHFLIFATHTHTGAGAFGGRFWERFIMGKRRRPVASRITQGIADAVRQALATQTPVQAEYGTTRIDDLVENRMDKKLDLPDSLKILRFKNETGEILGAMIFMAAHPTIVPADQLIFSADFPGVLTRELENKWPSAVVAFANGTSADLRPHFEEGYGKSFERVDSYGQKLVDRILNLSFQTISLDGHWQSILKKVRLPHTNIRAGWLRIPSFLGNRFFPRKTFFQAVRLGPLFFIALPAEVASEIGREMEWRIAGQDLLPFVITLANDYVAYAIPERYFRDRRRYESHVSFYGKKFDRFIHQQTDRLLHDLLTAEEKQKSLAPGTLTQNSGIPVLKLKGSAYHMGREEGRLLKNEIRQGMRDLFRYFRKQIPVPILNRLIISWMLNRAWKQMEPFVSYEEYEQIRGLADGAGVPLSKMRQLHALPEVYPTWCSNGAYWGPATKNGRMIALRNLDWNREIGVHRLAAVKYFESPGRQSYANIGYYGFTGVLSGINAKGISVGQIGATSRDETMRGVPMPFLLKRVLEESENLEEAVAIFKRSDRTRGYNYIVADAFSKNAAAIEATDNHLAIFYNQDPREKEIPYALSIDHALFRGDPALDATIRDLQWASKGDPEKPGLELPQGSAYEIRYRRHGELVQKFYGALDVESAKTIAREIAPPSNIQSVIYAFPEFWVANAQGDLRAAETEYVPFNFETLAASENGRRRPN